MYNKLAVLVMATCLISCLTLNAAFGSPSSGDKKFIAGAAQANMTEVALGKLGKTKGASDAVKSAGAMMIEDHTKLLDKLKMVAKAENVDVPTGMSQSQQGTLDKLNKLSGADFDKAYVKEMVNGHKGALADFQKEQKDTRDPNLKDLVTGAIPTIEHHLEMFDTLAQKK